MGGSYIIIIDATNIIGKYTTIMDTDNEMVVFDTVENAEETMKDHILNKQSYKIVDLLGLFNSRSNK